MALSRGSNRGPLLRRLPRSRPGRIVGLTVALALAIGAPAMSTGGMPEARAAEPRPAKGPAQQWGSAEGREAVVKGPGNTEVPLSQRAKYPLRQQTARPSPRRNTAEVGTPPAPRVTGFDRRTSREDATRRDEHSRTHVNADGTHTTEVATAPLHYRDPQGRWRPVTPRLTPAPGGWRKAADSVPLTLARRADAAALATLTFPTGESLAYGLDGAAPAPGSGGGTRVSYPSVLPATDLWLDSQAGGLKETLVLRSAQAPAAFSFPLRLTGLTARLDGGAVVLADRRGRTKAVIPAGFMVDARGTVSHAVRYELGDRDGTRVLTVRPDRAWLTDPARAFPVQLDPSVETATATTSMYVRQSGNPVSGANELQVGLGAGGPSATYLGFPGLDEKLRHHQIFGAQLQLVNYDARSCAPRRVSVHPVTQAWTVDTGGTYPGPSVGGSLTAKSFNYGYIKEGETRSGCPAAAELFNLGKAGRDLVQRWAGGTQANHGLSLRASATDRLGFKSFTGHATANPPRLYVTHSPYNASYTFPKPVPDPPVLQNQAGRVKITVTNKGAETWTPAGYYLAYRAYDAKGKIVTQQRAANLTGSVAHGGKVTLDATIKALKPGVYLLDFTMVKTGGTVFTDEQVPPGRLVIQVFDIAPVIKEQFPPNGYQAQTLTPQLWAAGVDIDAPPGSALQYKFEICAADKDGKPTACTTTPYQSSSAYPIPAGRLSWGTTYLWRGFVKDAANEVPTAQVALVATVPQPEITSRLAEAREREFDPNVGNVSTAATDASLAGIGPELTLMRTYNSLDPRRDLAFGAGWSTRYDMRLTPDGDGSGNVVIRYPDGQDVRFGRNADGTYAPPPGRYAKLTQDTALGTYRLQDKSGTTYDFSSGGLLVKVTDRFSTSVTYTYTGGRLTSALNTRTNRSLTFVWTGDHITKVSTNAIDGAPVSWTYSYTGDLLDKVCDPDGGCTQYTYGPGSHYATTVMDSRPASYWRLGEDEGTAADSWVAANLGKDRGSYTDITLKAGGAISGDPGTAASFDRPTSRITLPSGTLKKSRDAAVEIWFKTIANGVGGPLLGYQNKAWGTTPTAGAPTLYVGTDGKLRGQFWTGAVEPITDITKNVNDGRWHHAVLSVSGTTQSLYLDGRLSGTLTGRQLTAQDLTYNQIGAAHVVNPAAWPGWGTSAARSFTGTIDDVSVYHHPLGPAAVTAHHREAGRTADLLTKTTLPSGRTGSEITYDISRDRVQEFTDRDGGTWKIGAPAVFGGDRDLRRTVEVRDPDGDPYFYEYDGLSARLLRYGEPLAIGPRTPPTPTPSPTPPGPVCTSPDPQDPAFCTTPIGGGGGAPDFVRHPLEGMAIRSFAYDDNGFQTGITSATGDTVTLGYDDRGNVIRRTTCRARNDCQTAYTTYPAGAGDFDLRADQPTETRDGRSSGPTDNRYRTQYTYTASGAPLTETAADGGIIRTSYTTGVEAAVGGGSTPAGLPATTTDARNKVQRFQYFANGDLATVIEPSGLVNRYTYDALGRRITETGISDAQPSGVTTTYAYDKLSRTVSVTEPAATNTITRGRQQERTVTTYDPDGVVVRTEVSDLLGGDASRVMTFELDDHGRPERITDAVGGETSYTYDAFGNRTSMTDANGNHFTYTYTARDRPAEVRLRDWESDGGGNEHTVIQSSAYDMAGRLARHTDSMGRTVVYDYYGDDLVKSVTLKDFRNADGTKRDYVVESTTYDGAGNPLTETAANGSLLTEYTYDAVGRTLSEVMDPRGTARRTTYTYDLAGNVTTTSASGQPSNVPWPVSLTAETVRYQYDDAGNTTQETIENGTESRTTVHTYDQRGLRTSTTEPGSRRTDITYDELGRPISAAAPTVAVESGGSAPTESRPTTHTGYDAFGAVTHAVDPLGNTTRTAYDRLGRPVSVTGPGYTPPGATQPVTPTATQRYDALGNAVESTDAEGRTTRYTYDRQNRLTAKDVPVGTGTDRARWSYRYTRTGEVLSVTDPTGARAEATYDDLDRPITRTAVERRPTPAAHTTRFTYDDAGNVVHQAAPGGGASQFTYDGLKQLIRMVAPAGETTQFGYDISGRQVRVTDSLGRSAAKQYDRMGRLTQESDLDSVNNELRKASYRYDPAGNLTSATDSLGRTTSYAYDALDRLTSQTEPVTATRSLTTSFGYDLAGNRTRYTDGRGNRTLFTHNALGLPESVIEPS
ncbi:LamG-like jellyroll fold domain-containing protein, partial [Streptomyces sp. NPDC057638]|uniref:LamG-like jellyroll fold domain-containing protein n=1 Tax=Streptomyces sp. NPDC057638 TaxID=3346190 RepID=UPI0036AE893A